MIEAVKPKTKREEFENLQRQIGDVCFEVGRDYFEMELQKRSFADLEVKFHNLNKKAKDLHATILREEKEAAAKLKLAVAEPEPAQGEIAQ